MLFPTFARLGLLPPLLCLLTAAAAGPVSVVGIPRGALAGLTPTIPPAKNTALHLSVELEPADPSLETVAAQIADPASPQHHAKLTRAAFLARFARPQSDVDRLVAYLRANGANGIYTSANRLVVGADMTTSQAERAFNTRFMSYAKGQRTVIAPMQPLRIPLAGVRAVRGVVLAYTPRLEDAMPLPNDFRGEWYLAQRFRQGYDAAPGGGDGARIVLLEDSSDRAARSDIELFMKAPSQVEAPAQGGRPHGAPGAPPRGMAPQGDNGFSREPLAPLGADISRFFETNVAPPVTEQRCSRDDRGQEPTTDIIAAIALAPKAIVDVRYDALCLPGTDVSLPLQRVLDGADVPDVIVMPVSAGPVLGASGDAFGPVPIPYLEAAVRGIPIVVSSGDDGAFGFRIPGIDKPAVTYPCVLPYVICAGGTQLGQIGEEFNEGPWNDRVHASGGGISGDPRPSWQNAPSGFEFSTGLVKTRMVPDVGADAAGHLLGFWRGYGFGGVGGTSEAAAIVGAQLAAINAAVPKDNRLLTPGDLYVLATVHPEAFRDVDRANDRSIRDNTIRPRRQALPLDYKGVIPTPAPAIAGCVDIQPHGCEVAKGYDAVTGIGSLKENAAISALGAAGPAPSR
jgi:hypothetical protein